MLTRHCIVSPQFPGLTRNGGIGTHCYYLAQLLQKMEVETTLLYTQPDPDREPLAAGKLPFDLKFVWARELPKIECHVTAYFLDSSIRCYEWLKTQRFDAIHFQDWRADGFRSVQAKRTGQAFSETALTCMINGPNLWCRQGAKLDPFATREDILQDYCESYAARYCDELLSPSAYALEWASENWGINHQRAHVLPYMFQAQFQDETRAAAIKNLIFFGRLETRKGLEIFLQALRALKAKGSKPQQIFFLGRRSPMVEGDSVDYIQRYFTDHLSDWPCEIIDTLDHDDVLQFLHRVPDKLVVIPSLSETLCFTVIECLACNFNFIASRVGGIPELFGETDRLFAPNVGSLCSKIEQALAGELQPMSGRWSNASSEKLWTEFLQTLSPQNASTAVVTEARAQTPSVSVCIPHYNGKALLSETLQALAEQTYPNFEVLIGDDGSTDAFSLTEFARLQSLYKSRGWTFLREEQNFGPGTVRNRLARSGVGDYLLFVDSDNIPEPTMIERMVKAALKADLDAVGCFMTTRVEDSDHPSDVPIYSSWMPVGPALPTVFFDNLVGETNTLFKKNVFWKVGGFPEETNYGHEDWELLIRLILSGYSYDVVPEFLILYRIRPESHVRSTPTIHNRLRAWRPLFEHLPAEKQFLAASLFIWEWRIDQNNNGHHSRISDREMSSFQSSWLFQLHRLLRHPRKTVLSWLSMS